MGNIGYQLSSTSIEDLKRIFLIYPHDGIKFVYYTGEKIETKLWNVNTKRAAKRKGNTELSSLNE